MYIEIGRSERAKKAFEKGQGNLNSYEANAGLPSPH